MRTKVRCQNRTLAINPSRWTTSLLNASASWQTEFVPRIHKGSHAGTPLIPSEKPSP